MPTPPTYPARPVNGGAFPRALPKRGTWSYEPKLNGWRTLVHTPTKLKLISVLVEIVLHLVESQAISFFLLTI